MPILHDPVLETGREQLQFARAEIILGAQRLRALPSPPVSECHLMCDAVIEYFAALKALEEALKEAAS